MPGVLAAVHQAAVVVHAAAVARAEPHRDTGEYLSLLVVQDRGEQGSAVFAGAYYSNWIEYGTGRQRLPIAPTPCPHSPKEHGVAPQLIMLGAIADTTH